MIIRVSQVRVLPPLLEHPFFGPPRTEKKNGHRSTSRDHARLHRVQAAQLPDAEVQAELPRRVEFRTYCAGAAGTRCSGDPLGRARDPQAAPGPAATGDGARLLAGRARSRSGLPSSPSSSKPAARPRSNVASSSASPTPSSGRSTGRRATRPFRASSSSSSRASSSAPTFGASIRSSVPSSTAFFSRSR